MADDEDFGADAEFLSALASSGISSHSQQEIRKVTQPTTQRITQPTPQRFDRAPPVTNSTATGSPQIVQPTPQVIASRSSGSSIQVSPRQKGNPILTNLRSVAWEYSDIPADYVLGLTTCALFLSLKYHRLHPEYIYNRIKGLQGKYNLRILLTMVDIGNHEESLKELSKTSLVNNVTVILCWSASEAARYLELYKSYEHANPSAIKGVESKSYSEKLVDFITVPRSINKTDAVSLVSAFGSVRAAVNAGPEEISLVSGWGETKIKRWCSVVDEPFRARKAARRTLTTQETTMGDESEEGLLDRAIPLSKMPLREMSSLGAATTLSRVASDTRSPEVVSQQYDMEDDEEVLAAMEREEHDRSLREQRRERQKKDAEISDGVAAALAKLRETS